MIEELSAAPSIRLAHLFAAPAGWGLPARRLRDYQLQYCKAGEAEYIIEGRSCPMPPGTLFLLRPQEHHEIRSAPDVSHVCYSFVFSLGDAADGFEEMVGPARDRGNWRGTPLETQLSQLVAFYHQPGLENRIRCQSILMAVIAMLVQRQRAESGETGAKLNDLARSRMNLVQTHMANHYAEPLSLERLEDVAGIGRNHIIKQFRRIYSMTPMQYVTMLRIEQAKSLAVQTHLSVGEIAARVGYSDVHTFGRAFKRVTGVSLSQYCAGMVVPEIPADGPPQ